MSKQVFEGWQEQADLVRKELDSIGRWMARENYRKMFLEDVAVVTQLQEMLAEVNVFLAEATAHREGQI